MGIKVPPEIERQLMERGIVREHVVKLPDQFANGAYRQGERLKIVVEIPMKLPSLANARLHWAKKAKIIKSQREAVALVLSGHTPIPLPVEVTFTRLAAKKFGKMDNDNLEAAFKGPRDQVAKWLGVDDGNDGCKFIVRQEVGEDRAIRIEIEAVP